MGALWIATILAGWVGYVSNDFWEGKCLAPWGFKTMGSPGGRPYRPPVPLFGEIIGGALLPRPSELSVAGRWDQMIANWRFCIKIQHRPRSSSFCGEWTNPMVFTKDRPGPKSWLWKKGRIWLSHLVATEPILPGIGKKRERYILIHLKIVHNFHSCWSSKAATFWPLCTICSNWAKDLGRKWPHQILVQLARSNTSWNTLLKMNERHQIKLEQIWLIRKMIKLLGASRFSISCRSAPCPATHPSALHFIFITPPPPTQPQPLFPSDLPRCIIFGAENGSWVPAPEILQLERRATQILDRLNIKPTSLEEH